MPTGSSQVQPGVLLVTLHVSTLHPIRDKGFASFEWAFWSQASICLLLTVQHGFNMKGTSQMSFSEGHFGWFFRLNVEPSHACRDLCSHWPIRYRSAGEGALFSFRAFSWKAMLSLHSPPAPRGWCGDEGTCRAEHITCSS